MSPLYETLICSLLTFAVQPASHNCPIDMRECVLSSGTMCANVAAAGNSGMSRCPSCVDVIVLPSGIVMRMGFVAICMLVKCVSGVHKCVVHPVSSIILVSVGGPMVMDELLLAS